MDPDGGEVRLELGNPVGELDRLEVLAVLLEFGGTDPQGVGNDATEPAEGDRGEGEDGRCVGKDRGAGQAEAVAVLVQADLKEVARDQGEDGKEEEAGLAKVHVGRAISRRVRMIMPAMPMPPAVMPMTTNMARPRSSHVTERPVARASTGEKLETWLRTQ